MNKQTLDITTLLRPNIATLKPYKPILPFEVLSRQLGRAPQEIIKLDANENPYGPAPRVAKVLAEAPYLHIYPDPESRDLRAALADYTNVPAEYLLVGHGADELIDLIMRLFLNPGDSIINCPPTFGMYSFDAAINGATVIDIWRKTDFQLDTAAIRHVFETTTPRPKLIFITSPNNPDGSVIDDATLKTLLNLPTLVVLDEAYVEFSQGGRIEWMLEYPNLIVLRTFSKWAGLAGLRVGYGAFPPAILAHLWKIKQPYNVNVAGQLAAQVSLQERAMLLQNVGKIIKQRTRFFEVLADIAWLEPYPSETNFILCRVVGHSAATVKQQLADQGVLIRYYDSPRLTDHIRISIGTEAQMTRLVKILQTL